MKRNIVKKISILIISTLISVCTCNGVYAFASDVDTNLKTLAEQNAELKAENKRLTNMLSQYRILVNGLVSENDSLKAVLEQIEESQEDNKTYLGEFTTTYYCTENYQHICGGGGTTASGTVVKANRTVAVDTSIIPLGTKLYIEGIGIRIAEDTGSAINGSKIDIAVATHNEALALGKKSGVKVWVIK